MAFSQSAGYRYSRSSGAGTDFLYANRRGTIIKDGQEFPIISSFGFRNYLLITRRADLDMSFWVSYEHYPLGTQEDELNLDVAQEGIFANLSTEFALTPVIKGFVYEDAVYRTDYVDTRGIADEYGGEKYEYFRNKAGLDVDWLIAKDKNLGGSASRLDVIPRDDEFYDKERITYHEGLSYEQEVLPGIIAGMRAGYWQTDYRDSTRQDTDRQDYSLFASVTRGDVMGVGVELTEMSTLSLSLGYSFGYRYGRARTLTTTSDAGGEESDIEREAESDMESVVGEVALRTHLRHDLSHSVNYFRRLRGGFNSAFELVDAYNYRIDWKGKATTASLYTGLSVVEPSAGNKYSDWHSGIDISYPLVPYIALLLSSKYTVRENHGIVVTTTDAEEEIEVEWQDDYNTWVSQIGTSFSVTRRIKFYSSVQHIERESDSSNLEYERDIFLAMFTYTRQF